MSLKPYDASELFHWLTIKENVVILDVRNEDDFKRFKVESPYPMEMHNISYIDFMETEEESVAKVPAGRPIRVVCSKEGSAKYVGEILEKHGFSDVGFLTGGIKTWGNLLVPKTVYIGDDYELYQFIRPGKASCSYGLLTNGQIMLFDPSRNIDFYIDFAREKNCKIIKTFETHLQADYIAGSRMIAEKTGAEFWANNYDFNHAKTNHLPLVEGAVHTFAGGGPEVLVIFTPGHTPGSTTYQIDNHHLISGDMIFIESIGRPDLGGKAVEWAGIEFQSLKKIKKLDESLIVLPGHFINWIEANDDLIFALPLGDVKKRNEQIYKIDQKENFVQFIKDNIRAQPEEYATIRLVNANLKQVDADEQEVLDLGKNECAASAYAKTHDKKSFQAE